jgi:hypothetical protein
VSWTETVPPREGSENSPLTPRSCCIDQKGWCQYTRDKLWVSFLFPVFESASMPNLGDISWQRTKVWCVTCQATQQPTVLGIDNGQYGPRAAQNHFVVPNFPGNPEPAYKTTIPLAVLRAPALRTVCPAPSRPPCGELRARVEPRVRPHFLRQVPRLSRAFCGGHWGTATIGLLGSKRHVSF